MDAQTMQRLSGELKAMERNPAALATTAQAAIMQCDDALCRNQVLEAALNSQSRLIPVKVAPTHEIATSTVAAGMVGMERGFLGPVAGRATGAGQALLAFGGYLYADSIESKRLAQAALQGTLGGLACNEGRDLGAAAADRLHKATAPSPAPAAH